MHYILTPLKTNPNIYMVDDYGFCDKRTDCEKQDIQSRWNARKLHRHVTKNISQNRDQPFKKI